LELTKTQKQVLKVLFENNDKWLNATEIKNKSKEFINSAHIKVALIKLRDNDYVFYDYSEDKFQISPDGESAYRS
jgi:hypothetical protein